jgi:hypothetical protein
MKRRDLFQKENFMEGNRQRWVFIFLAFMILIITLDALRLLKDPTPYLTFLTFLAGSFILGYSGTSVMQLFRSSSTTENQNIEDNQNITEKKEVSIKQEILTNNAKEDDYNITGVNV